MKNNIFVSKYNCKDTILYAKIDWKENDCDLFHIKLNDGDYSWTGRFSMDFAKTFMDRVEESAQEYFKNVRAALENEDDIFAYELSLMPNNTESAAFSWKKKFSDSVMFVHGCVPVHKIGKDNKEDLIDILLQENTSLRKLVEDFDRNLELVNSELDQSRYELEKFMNLKTSLEMSVYGKFIHLLNTKKKRIQALEENLYLLESTNQNINELD